MADVCVVGSFMMDLVVRAPRRPTSGETLFGHSFEQFRGGKGFNQAVAAARAGARTAMVGRLGDDAWGGDFRAALGREGIDATNVGTDAHVGTGVATPLVEDDGSNSIVVVPRANLEITPQHLASVDLLATSSVVLMQLELPVTTVVAAARAAHAAGATVILNPAPAVCDLSAFRGLVDILVPNQAEATLLTGIDCESDISRVGEAADALRTMTGAAAVVITLGAAGVLVVDDAGHQHLPSHVVSCIDTVGAGDAFCGAMAAALAARAPLIDAVRRGVAAGALAVTRAGAEPSMPTSAEVDALLGADVLASSLRTA